MQCPTWLWNFDQPNIPHKKYVEQIKAKKNGRGRRCHGFDSSMVYNHKAHAKSPSPTFRDCLNIAYCDEDIRKSYEAYHILEEKPGKFEMFEITVRIQ